TSVFAPPGGNNTGGNAPTLGDPRRASAVAATTFATEVGNGLVRKSGSAKATSVLLNPPPRNAPPPAAITATYCRPSRPMYVIGLECSLASSLVSQSSFPLFESQARSRVLFVARTNK